MRRIEPKRELKDYESEGSAIRRIMMGEAMTQGKSFHQNRTDLANRGIKSKPIDKDKFFSTMKGHMKDQDKRDKAAGMIKMRKSDATGVHGTTVNRNDKKK